MTNGRASVDFACEGAPGMKTPWAPGYTIGAGGLLFWAAGLAPSKDAVWTTVHEPGAPP